MNKIKLSKWWFKRLVILGLLVPGVILVTFEVKYWQRVYPGLAIAGTDVGGLTKKEAEVKLKKKTDSLKTLILGWGVNQWPLPLELIGLKYDLENSVGPAWDIGRRGKWIENLRQKFEAGKNGMRFDLKYEWDSEKVAAAIATVAAQIDLPAKEPEITLDKLSGQVLVTSGENGYWVNREALEKKLDKAVKTVSNNRIDVPIVRLLPKLTSDEISIVKDRGQKLVGKKLVLAAPEVGQNWEINDEQLLTWLEGRDGIWRKDKIAAWVEQLAHAVDKPAQDASFRFVEPGRVEEFKPAKDGFRVKQPEMINKITESLWRLEQSGQTNDLTVEAEIIKPGTETAQVNDLGINELIGMGESWFSGSITNRIFNLRKAAEMLNGVLVAPGETFSFNERVGEVSADTGYKQAYIIKEGKTILGDGGGVCQVSTTLFRAVLNAGLPIEERVAHAYRVRYYEEKYQVGFDATVFQPSPDFKFKNDTPGHVLIQTEFSEKDKHLAFKLYGTSDGRLVNLSKSRVWEVVAPPPDLYIDDATLPAGTVKQTEHAAWGAKVAFDWKVTRGEEVLQERTFYSNYRSWQAVYLRGTKTN